MHRKRRDIIQRLVVKASLGVILVYHRFAGEMRISAINGENNFYLYPRSTKMKKRLLEQVILEGEKNRTTRK